VGGPSEEYRSAPSSGDGRISRPRVRGQIVVVMKDMNSASKRNLLPGVLLVVVGLIMLLATTPGVGGSLIPGAIGVCFLAGYGYQLRYGYLVEGRSSPAWVPASSSRAAWGPRRRRRYWSRPWIRRHLRSRLAARLAPVALVAADPWYGPAPRRARDGDPGRDGADMARQLVAAGTYRRRHSGHHPRGQPPAQHVLNRSGLRSGPVPASRPRPKGRW
jgi:hypothetical protein